MTIITVMSEKKKVCSNKGSTYFTHQSQKDLFLTSCKLPEYVTI